MDHPSLNRASRRKLTASAVIAAFGLSAPPLRAADTNIIAPWTGLGKNIVASFSGSNAVFHLSALAGTFLIVETGLDMRVHNYFAGHAFMEGYSRPVVHAGSHLPAVLGVGLLAAGWIGGGSRLATAGSAVIQASLLALGTELSLKALTGRPGPDPVVYDDDSASKVFRFGFLRGGVYHGWPSGHMMTNVAAVTSLMAFYKDKTLLNIAGGAYLGYLFLGVVSHARSAMHWFSDAVAGSLMGIAIGTTIGREFRRRFDHEGDSSPGVTGGIMPGRFAITICLDI